MRGTLLLIALSVSWLSLSPAGASVEHGAARGTLPRLMLWAWERPTDLRALDQGVGVAFLAQTLTLRHDAVQAEPRRNPLRVSAHTPLVAVTRIESGGGASALEAPQVASMVAAIAHTAALPRVAGVQIDFDATASEHHVYRALIYAVRRELPHGMPLSVTALASWCAGDRWMRGLPVDETVPMLFRMGPLNEPYAGLARSTSTAAPECRGALGTSLDEPLHVRGAGRRIYVFNAAPWTPASVTRAREVLE